MSNREQTVIIDSSVDYERLYGYRFRGIEQARREAVWSAISRHIYHRMGAPESILDPAAGRGEFIRSIPSADRWAVDVMPQEGLAEAGVTAIVSDIRNAALPSSYFDGVFASNFLEHLPDHNAVAEVLLKFRDVMRCGGRIAIMGPNFKFCANEYFDCADHAVILTHVSVAEHLHAAGFNVTDAVPRFLPYSFRGRLPASPLLTRAYLRAPLAWRILGRQFLVLGHKPSGRQEPQVATCQGAHE